MTTTALPAPLTPEDCNLQDFAFMPLDVARLRDSDMAAYESPEACWAAVLLWSAAWHQVPAASLPDDDRFLAKAAGYGRVVKEWANVREGALHGWIKCADGRLYHPVVAEKALESWKAKVHHQWKKECDRIRKSNKQRESEGRPLLPLPPEPGSTSDNIPPEPKGIPPESGVDSDGNDEEDAGNPLENALKGQGEGEGQGEGQGQGEFKNPPPAPRAPTQPQPVAAEIAPPNGAAVLSKAMRAFGINSNPGDLRLIALADQGVTVDTVTAACEAAKKAKPNEAIPPAYVLSILESWAKKAAELKASGAAPPRQGQPGYQTANDRARTWASRINGDNRNDRHDEPEFIDLNPPPAGKLG